MELLAVVGAVTITWFTLKLMVYVFREWLGVEFRVPWKVIEEAPAAEEPEEHPCTTCLRWPECNGVDADVCSIMRDWNKARDKP